MIEMIDEVMGQNTLNNFSSKRYSRKCFTKNVPLYGLFYDLDNILYEVFNR